MAGVDAKLVDVLLPHLGGVRVVDVEFEDDVVCIRAVTRGAVVACPDCEGAAHRVHDRYERRVADATVGGRRVVIRLQVRRFLYGVITCARRTFVEQVAGLTFRHGRMTLLLRGVLEAIAAALAGRPGARLAARTGNMTSRSTLLRLLRAIEVPPVEAGPRALRVDDFAIRRGATYATILLDMDGHRPIDVLPDRTAATFAARLRQHPGTKIICRDRGGSYAEGARIGAPEAVQVADRYHLWANLGDAVEKTVNTHQPCLRDDAATDHDDTTDKAGEEDGSVQNLDVDGCEPLLVVRKRDRYLAIQDLVASKAPITTIAARLGVSTRTVHRYLRATSLGDALAPAFNRTSRLDRFKEHLLRRWKAGCTNATTLHAEIQDMGWRGSVRTVHRYTQRLRALDLLPEPASVAPKPRVVARWIMTNPDNLTVRVQVRMKEVLARCPKLEATRRHVASFAAMMRDLSGDRLESWMTAIEADDLPSLHVLVKGLRRDLEAVTNGLTLPWSSGAVEGAVNRAKALKRSMYGRANLDLLRHRILLPN